MRALLATLLPALLLLPAAPAAPGAEGVFLDNGTTRVGVARDHGASIFWLSASGSDENLVNTYDQGRLIQQSYYAGRTTDRRDEGQSPSWSPWPWNPIQGGSYDGKPSEVVMLEHHAEAGEIRSVTRPRLWDMDGEPAHATMEQLIQFEPAMPDTVRIDCRFVSQREPADRWGTDAIPRHQELPALYFIARLSEVVTYVGDRPWTDAPTTRLELNFPWKQVAPAERWMACASPDGTTGAGVFSPSATEVWNYGGFGDLLAPAQNGTAGNATVHVAPLATMALAPDAEITFTYWLILGDPESVRARAEALRQKD